jgi:hypothetical protein
VLAALLAAALLLTGAAPPPEGASPEPGPAVTTSAPGDPALPAIVAGQLSTPDVTIHFTERARGSVARVLSRIESERAALRPILGESWLQPIAVRLGAGREELEALALPGSAPPAWGIAVAYPGRHLMLLDATSLADPANATTIRHELVHLALGQLGDFPRWFHEGLAVLISGEDFDLGHYAAMHRGVRQNRLASFEALARGWPEHRSDSEIAYAQSCSFVAFLMERHGPAAFADLYRHVREGTPFELAFARAFRTSIGVEGREWEQTLAFRYGTMPVAAAVSLLWGGAALLCVAAFVRRRAAKERNLRRMDLETAAEEGWVEPVQDQTPLPPEDPGASEGPPRLLH